MVTNLLSIAETSQGIEIKEEKLRFMCSKVNIWDQFGMSRSQYISLSDDEKLKMLKGFYKALLPVYFSSGKHQFCCNDCVWFDDGKKQDCLKCKVNVMACSCFSEFSADEKVPSVNAFKNMATATKAFDAATERQQKELFNQENGLVLWYWSKRDETYWLSRPKINLITVQVHLSLSRQLILEYPQLFVIPQSYL